jgi:YVTN family beta-propeller protein
VRTGGKGRKVRRRVGWPIGPVRDAALVHVGYVGREDSMQSENSKSNCTRRTQAFAALWAAVVMTGVSAGAAKAAPFAYVTAGHDDVVVIDTATNSVVASVPIAGDGRGLAVTPDGKFVYVTNTDVNSVDVISTASNVGIGNIQVGLAPSGVAITPDGRLAYVSNFNSNSVSVIQASENRPPRLIATVPVGARPMGLERFPPDMGHYAYPACRK